MSRGIAVFCALSTSLLLAGCVVRHHRHQQPEPPPPESRVQHHRRPAPEPEVADPATHRAPPAVKGPRFHVTVTPAAARGGDEVELRIEPAPATTAMIYYDGRPMPKKDMGGGLYVVTVPVGATSGHFAIELDGRQYRSNRLHVTP